MRSEWKNKKIGDVVDIRRGASPRPIQNFLSKTGMPWVKIADATGDPTRFIQKTNECIIEEGISKSVKVEPETLIVSNSATPGLPKIMKIQACVHDGWLVFSNYRGVLRDFLYYKFIDIRRQLVNQANGSVFQNLKTDIVRAFDIDLPPIEEQHKIVDLLTSIDLKIETNIKINDNLEQQAQVLFRSWFINFEVYGGSMPMDWKVVPFEEVADFQNGYAFKSKELLSAPESKTYKVFKQGHICRGGGFNIEGTKSWYPRSKAEKLQKFVLHKGDILMAMTDMKNNVAILGNTALMPYDEEYILNQRVGLLRPKINTGITYPFLYLLTNSEDFLKDLRSRANSGVQVNLSASEIKFSQTILAPKEINEKFSEIVVPMYEKIMQNQLENQKLKELRDSLLPKLMLGEIDVSDVNFV